MDLLIGSFNHILRNTHLHFKASDRFSTGIDKWDLENPMLQQWLGYNFGLLEAGALSLFGSNREYDIARDVALNALIETQFDGMPGLDIYMHFELSRLNQRTRGEDNCGVAASLFDVKPFKHAYGLAVEDMAALIRGQQRPQLGLLEILSEGTTTIKSKSDNSIDHTTVSGCHAEEVFSTEHEALDFAKWANSTTPNANATVHQLASGKWATRWIETIYLESDVKLRDIDSLDDEFIFS